MMIKRCTVLPGAGLTLLLVCLLSTASWAQLTREPLPRTPRNQQAARVRSHKLDTLQLPFWEDFSFTVINQKDTNFVSDYPLDSLWFRSKSVWVNNSGWNAPTVNVATFDGLDSLGIAYSNDNMLNGFRDTLMSHAIDLAAVPVAERNSVYLSFFYQWQGHGEPPDEGDFLQLQFKNSDNVWENVMRIQTKASFRADTFYDTIIAITAEKYYHRGFQFRLSNYGRKSGPYDTWNVDYIYLAKGRSLNDNSFPERAIASQATQLFGQYSAMPIQHFWDSKKTIGPVYFDVQNMKNQSTGAISIDYYVTGTFWNYIDSVATPYETPLGNRGVKGESGGIMNPFERVQVKAANEGNVTTNSLPDTTDTNQFNPNADAIRIKLSFRITGDDTDPQAPAYAPVNFTSNDTLSANYWLADYYAYDDGTAEYSAKMTSFQNKVAYAFDLPPGQLDTLAGFYGYFPNFGITSNTTADFIIYGDKDGLPDDNNVLYTLSGTKLQRMGVNQFQRIDIREVVLVQDRFYISFGNSPAAIGLDISQDRHDKIFDFINQVWEPNDRFGGTLMIRPIFGKGKESIVTDIPPNETVNPVQTYPNPSNGSFYLNSRQYQVVRIISVTGQPIGFDAEVKGEGQQITLRQPAPGLYILQLRRGDSFWSHKILVR
jgi:hypothetical protein